MPRLHVRIRRGVHREVERFVDECGRYGLVPQEQSRRSTFGDRFFQVIHRRFSRLVADGQDGLAGPSDGRLAALERLLALFEWKNVGDRDVEPTAVDQTG